MRAVIWLVLLFVVAVVTALMLGNNDGLASFYWRSWRLDISLNLFLLLLVGSCFALVTAIQAIESLTTLPRRAREWVDRYGDPRGKDLDAVVDWIERIPYTETRSYVQRVMENYEVYKMRISGGFDIAGDLVDGRR